jgi:anti-sigma B factor antagonist
MAKTVLDAVRGARSRAPDAMLPEPLGEKASGERQPARGREACDGPPAARRLAAVPTDPVLVRIRARMDEFSYSPGHPNVLSMTKYVLDASVDGPAASREAHAAEPVVVARSDAGDETRLELRGVFDATTSGAVRAALEAIVAERRKAVVVDLNALRIIDSTGVRLLLGMRRSCTSYGGTMTLAGVHGQPLEILRLLRLDEVLGIR